MTTRIVLFSQPGCLSCELVKVFLEAKEIAFEEHDINADSEARRIMIEDLGSQETPTLVVFSGNVGEDVGEVVVGFDLVRLDQLLDAASSSNPGTES